MIKRKLVLVNWDDSNVTHGWRLDDCSEDKVDHCRTVGILIADNEKGMTIALGDSDCGSVMETITIPKGCIIKIKELRIR